MLYEKKRTFGKEPIELDAAAFAVGANVFAGQAVSATEATAATIDYEAENQQFPAENTLEVFGFETAASVGGAATLAVSLQTSADGVAWNEEVSFSISQSQIVKDKLIKRFTVPANAKRHLRFKLTVGTEVFTAGKILAMVRPL